MDIDEPIPSCMSDIKLQMFLTKKIFIGGRLVCWLWIKVVKLMIRAIRLHDHTVQISLDELVPEIGMVRLGYITSRLTNRLELIELTHGLHIKENETENLIDRRWGDTQQGILLFINLKKKIKTWNNKIIIYSNKGYCY